MIVHVTAEDIAGGYPMVSLSPLDLAIRRTTGLEGRIEVYHDQWLWWDGQRYRTYPMPPEASQFVKDYKIGRSVAPATFDIPGPTA
jgi:hypothetical protein